MKNALSREEGASMVEYVLVLALVALAAFGVLKTLGQNVKSAFQTAANDVSMANSGN
jgi:Flp pilus assembly pilin Flp